MSTIAPTLLAESADQYKALVEKLHPFAKRTHIDLTDGEFAPSFTISPAQVWWPDTWTADIHAMVARPSEYVDTLIAMKPNLIILHSEVQEDILPLLQQIKAAGIKAGVALLRSTVPSTVSELIETADHVMIFSGDLGHNGGTASMMQLEKVRLIRNIRTDVEIGWDGGVNIENAFTLAQGGVDVLYVGETIASSDDPKTAYDTLVSEINKHGII